jgi:hypothetical protein
MKHYIVTNTEGLRVRSQMDTRNDKTILRTMHKSEGFDGYQEYQIPGPTGLQTWVRLSTNSGDVRQEYACIRIGNRHFAKEEEDKSKPAESTQEWMEAVDTYLRTKLGYRGPRP